MKKFIHFIFFLFLSVALFTPTASAGNFWDGWKPGEASGFIPECGANVLDKGEDHVQQALVDVLCRINPGPYSSYINPVAYDIYKAKTGKYKDGKTAVILFPGVDIALVTMHNNGFAVYDVLRISNGESAVSKSPRHPLNLRVCDQCHKGYSRACPGGICGNRRLK